MSLCPFNQFEPCPEACALASADEPRGCLLARGAVAIPVAIAALAEVRAMVDPGTQTAMDLGPHPVSATEFVDSKGAAHYAGMRTKDAYVEVREAMARGEVTDDGLPQRAVTNLVTRRHRRLYVDNTGSSARFQWIGGAPNE